MCRDTRDRLYTRHCLFLSLTMHSTLSLLVPAAPGRAFKSRVLWEHCMFRKLKSPVVGGVCWCLKVSALVLYIRMATYDSFFSSRFFYPVSVHNIYCWPILVEIEMINAVSLLALLESLLLLVSVRSISPTAVTT